jgi:hypothetical protein
LVLFLFVSQKLNTNFLLQRANNAIKHPLFILWMTDRIEIHDNFLIYSPTRGGSEVVANSIS